tara:strand:- start:575 stop:1141 length:567 start_codon:yes stop_codon:yes gene_type:complete
MHNEKTNVGDTCSATVDRGASHEEEISLHGTYEAVCHDRFGDIKWVDVIGNLVTTVGKNFTMDTVLGNVAGGAVVMGLKGTGTAVVGNTQASHAAWLEVGLANLPTYSGTRKTPVFSAAAAGVKSTSTPVVFTMTGSGTVAGCFINIGGLATVDNTTGTLFSAGDFTAGSKTVTSGDTLSVSYSATAA